MTIRKSTNVFPRDFSRIFADASFSSRTIKIHLYFETAARISVISRVQRASCVFFLLLLLGSQRPQIFVHDSRDVRTERCVLESVECSIAINEQMADGRR